MTGVEEPEHYACQHLREALAADPRLGELGVQVQIASGKVFLSGQVSTPERQAAVALVAAEVLPGYEVHNDTVVTPADEAPRVEHLP